MNETVNKILLGGDKFMPEMHLTKPAFTACGPFTKNKEIIQKFKETGDSRYIYQNKLDKVCFQHDFAYADFKDLTRRTTSDNILCDKAFNIAKNPQYDGYQRGLASIVYEFLDKKTTSGSCIKNEKMPELRKPIIRKFEKRRVHSPFIDNVWGADLADKQLIFKFNKGIYFLLCVLAIFS